MKELIREFERTSGLEVYGLGRVAIKEHFGVEE